MPHDCPPCHPSYYDNNPYPKRVKRARHIVDTDKCHHNKCDSEEEEDVCEPRYSFPFPFQLQQESEITKEKKEKDAYYRLKDEEYKKREEALARKEREYEFNPPADDTFSCISGQPLPPHHSHHPEPPHHNPEHPHHPEHPHPNNSDSDSESDCLTSVLSDDLPHHHHHHHHGKIETYILRIPKKNRHTPAPTTTIIKKTKCKNIYK